MGSFDLIKGKAEAQDEPKSKAVAEFQNPFLRSRISVVRIRIYNREVFHNEPRYAGQIEMSATVEFKNGGTSGEQTLTAETFDGLVEKINAFIKGMG